MYKQTAYSPPSPTEILSSQLGPVSPWRHRPQLWPEKFPLHWQVRLKKRSGHLSLSSRPSWGYWGPWGRRSAAMVTHWPRPVLEPHSSPATPVGEGQHWPLLRPSGVTQSLGNWAAVKPAHRVTTRTPSIVLRERLREREREKWVGEREEERWRVGWRERGREEEFRAERDYISKVHGWNNLPVWHLRNGD